jgi:Antitoxin-like ribbon-helix-helix
MKRKRSLSEALQAVAGSPRDAAVTRGASRHVERVVSEEPPATTSARAGKRLVGGHFDKAVSRQLRELAAREDTTVQALLAEAMNMLFAARGLPEIAES